MKPKILIDNQEKRGWNFSDYNCETKIVNLPTGDYTVEGFEENLCIERKASTGELAVNLGRNSKTFEKEFIRMQTFKHKYVICEFPITNFYCFPEKSTIPRSTWPKVRMNGKYIHKAICELCDKYGVTLIFCETKEEAERTCIGILAEISGQNYEDTW